MEIGTASGWIFTGKRSGEGGLEESREQGDEPGRRSRAELERHGQRLAHVCVMENISGRRAVQEKTDRIEKDASTDKNEE